MLPTLVRMLDGDSSGEDVAIGRNVSLLIVDVLLVNDLALVVFGDTLLIVAESFTELLPLSLL